MDIIQYLQINQSTSMHNLSNKDKIETCIQRNFNTVPLLTTILVYLNQIIDGIILEIFLDFISIIWHHLTNRIFKNHL